MPNPRGHNGSKTIRDERVASINMARRAATDWSDEKGMSYHAANRLYDKFRKEASHSSSRESGCWMKVGV